MLGLTRLWRMKNVKHPHMRNHPKRHIRKRIRTESAYTKKMALPGSNVTHVSTGTIACA